MDIKKIGTEQRNQKTLNIDKAPTSEIIRLINEEDKTVAFAVEKALPQITLLVDAIVQKFNLDGRLIYVGAGTSGRIGIIDAVECRPTFSVDDEMVQCLMAGGEKAMMHAVEGAEDSVEMAVADLQEVKLTKNDVVVGIAASGRTPYVLGAIEYAKKVGAVTGGITTSPNSRLASIVDFPIEAVTGPEPLTGSTRMKSGTAQKMICNMISTASMIKMGKVYENLMIDVQMNNLKLVKRAQNILSQATGIDMDTAQVYIDKFGSVKKALLAIKSGIDDVKKVEAILQEAKGNIHIALEKAQ